MRVTGNIKRYPVIGFKKPGFHTSIHCDPFSCIMGLGKKASNNIE